MRRSGLVMRAGVEGSDRGWARVATEVRSDKGDRGRSVRL